MAGEQESSAARSSTVSLAVPTLARAHSPPRLSRVSEHTTYVRPYAPARQSSWGSSPSTIRGHKQGGGAVFPQINLPPRQPLRGIDFAAARAAGEQQHGSLAANTKATVSGDYGAANFSFPVYLSAYAFGRSCHTRTSRKAREARSRREQQPDPASMSTVGPARELRSSSQEGHPCCELQAIRAYAVWQNQRGAAVSREEVGGRRPDEQAWRCGGTAVGCSEVGVVAAWREATRAYYSGRRTGRACGLCAATHSARHIQRGALLRVRRSLPRPRAAREASEQTLPLRASLCLPRRLAPARGSERIRGETESGRPRNDKERPAKKRQVATKRRGPGPALAGQAFLLSRASKLSVLHWPHARPPCKPAVAARSATLGLPSL